MAARLMMSLLERELSRVSVVLVAPSLAGGGSERQLADMANYWVARDLRITLATWSGPDIPDFYDLDERISRRHLDVPRRAYCGKITSNLQRILELRRLISAVRPQAVLSFLTESNVLTILAGIGSRSRIVVSERVQPSLDTGVPLAWRALRRVVYAWSDDVVVQTREVAQWVGRHCRTEPLIIPNALRSLSARAERQELVVAVGRLVRQKGFDLLLTALATVSPKFPDWRVAIVGDGRERDALERLRDDLGLGGVVDFLGQVQDSEAWMARAGLVVQPSRFEGFPNVVLEAMGTGAAVISSNCSSGPSDLIEDGVNGRLVPVESAAALAEAMTELMGRPELRARLGREAMKVRMRFRQDAIMPRWEAVLFQGLESGKTVLRARGE